MTFKHSIVLDVTTLLLASTTLTGVRIGFIGSLSPGTGLSTLRDAGVTIGEISAADGMNGEKLVLVSAGTGEDITKGVRAYKYLAETGEVDFIISGSIDDVSLGWLPCMQKLRIPTLDTWASYIDIIDMVIEDPGTMVPYFMNIASDEALATLYINFGADVLKEGMGWDSVVTLAKDTAFGEVITGLATETLGPATRIEIKEIITYDVDTVNFMSLSSKTQASETDFIYQVSSANSQVISSQYVKSQMPMVMTGVNVSALGFEYWEGTGDASGGVFTPLPIPSVGLELGPESQRFVDTYQAKYDSRPKMPHFNGFNAYWGLKQAVAAIEAAGGFGDAKVWSVETKKQDIALKKNGKVWLHCAFQGGDEVEEVTGRTYLHNARFDLTAPYDDAQPSMVVIQWKEDGEVGVVYPPEYVTTRLIASSWVKQLQACELGCFSG